MKKIKELKFDSYLRSLVVTRGQGLERETELVFFEDDFFNFLKTEFHINVVMTEYSDLEMLFNTDKEGLILHYDFDNKYNTTLIDNVDNHIATPYNINFGVYVFTRNIDDNLQIVEQILPYFTPDFTVTLQLVPQMNELKDIPIILNNISQEDTYTGDFKERQSLIWTLDFTLKGYLYGPVKTNPIIKYAIVNYYTPEVPDGQLDTAVGVVNAVCPAVAL